MDIDISGFSKYLVIFVDILGSQERNDFSETYKINEIFHEEFHNNQNNDREHTVYYRKCYSFSDCAYIFYGYKDGIDDSRKKDDELFKVALCNCEPIFLRFIKEKIIFRGGITFGNAYVDKSRSMFFGEAVNRAYQIESKEAIHPRIVIDDIVAKAVKDNIESVKYEMIKSPQYLLSFASGIMPKMPETGDGIIDTDVDGRYIFNYLHFPENNINIFPYYESSESFLKELVEFCNEQIEKSSNFHVIDKYIYLLNFAKEKLDYLQQ